MDQKITQNSRNHCFKKFLNEDEMLIEVLKQLVEQQDINVIGGRVWKLEVESKAYRLFYQTGKLQKIRPDFQLKLTEYPIFDLIAKERTILGNETNSILRKKGIFKYSASGVGDKIKINEKFIMNISSH